MRFFLYTSYTASFVFLFIEREGGSEGELGFCSFLARETQDQLPPEAATAFGAGLDRLMEDMLNRLQGGTRHLN